VYFKEPDSEKDFICSMPDSSGMHKCDALPLYEENHVECTASMVEAAVNSSACVNWNMYFTDCKAGDRNPFHGAISFDNIGLAWVAIFLVSLARADRPKGPTFLSPQLRRQNEASLSSGAQ